ncbi:MAG: hypothetical protein AAFR52_12095, partial [Pseudomonadota bacterium]
MANRQECFVLLRTGWRPGMAEFSGMIRARYPELGRVAGTDGPPDSGMPSTVLIDGITISMSIVNAPYPPEALLSPTRLIDHVDPEPLVANQAAYVLLAVEGPDIDPQAFGKAAAEASEIAQAYAALLTLAASVVAAEAPAMAAFWADSWRLVPPERLVEAGEGIMDGRLPWELWTSFAEVKGARAGGGDNRALISFGLRKFAGREVEVAPSPIPLVEAEKLAQAMVGRLIAG